MSMQTGGKIRLVKGGVGNNVILHMAALNQMPEEFKIICYQQPAGLSQVSEHIFFT